MAKILVVEDESLVQRLMADVLSSAGHEVRAGETVAEARACLGDGWPDLVVSDLALRDGTAIDIGAVSDERGVPMLVVTGWHDHPARARLRWPLLQKPFWPHALLEATSRLLAAARPPPMARAAARARPTVLIAEDNDVERMILRRMFTSQRPDVDLQFVTDGEELLDYLYARGRFAAPPPPWPTLVLLDVLMPRLDGRTALRMIRDDRRFDAIPIVILANLTGFGRLTWPGAQACLAKPNDVASWTEAVIAPLERWLGPGPRTDAATAAPAARLEASAP